MPGGAGRVRLWSRLGNEKTSRSRSSCGAEHWGGVAARSCRRQIVALDAKETLLDFNNRRAASIFLIHPPVRPVRPALPALPAPYPLTSPTRPSVARVAYIAFDLLREGRLDLREQPLVERRAALERLFGRTGSPILRISEIARGSGRALYQRALDSGWEGLIAKHAMSLYKSGKRTPDWRKLKIVQEQEFVVGGWTEPRQTRISARFCSVYENGELIPCRSHRDGLTRRELARVMKLLKPLETRDSPFRDRLKTNERPCIVKLALVAQKLTEWTADGKLRHPVYSDCATTRSLRTHRERKNLG